MALRAWPCVTPWLPHDLVALDNPVYGGIFMCLLRDCRQLVTPGVKIRTTRAETHPQNVPGSKLKMHRYLT